MRIAHISDLHFGTVLPALAEGLRASLQAQQPDLIAVSGDLTQRAKVVEYEAAQRFLAQIPFPQIVVPGNHDIPLYNVFRRFWRPLARFKRYISAEPYPFYHDVTQQVAVLGINTARSFTIDNGGISPAQMKVIRERFCALPADCFRILITHHPFLPPPASVIHDRPLVKRGRSLLRHLAACSPDVLLAGHFHLSYAAGTHTYRPYAHIQRSTLVIQAGTALSSRLRNELNAYNLLDIQPHEVTVTVCVWQNQQFRPQRQIVYEYQNLQWQQRKSEFAK